MGPRTAVTILIALLLAARSGRARDGDPPFLTGIFPPGASVGREVAWTLTGDNLARVGSVVVTGEGVSVVALHLDGPSSLKATVRVAPEAEPGYRDVRVDGPDGASNALIVRVDPLPQAVEAEPNDEPGSGQEIAVGSAVAGRLGPMDRDHYRVRGTPSDRVTLDLEVRRLGMAFAPVVTATTASGRAIAQGRETPGGDRDCRMEVTIPEDGRLVVQVRDNLYGGGDHAGYRLRVSPTPARAAPPRDRPQAGISPIAPGEVIDGAIDVPGAVARFRLPIRSGEPISVRVEPSEGSRLDPVATVRAADGRLLAEGDDTRRLVPGSPIPETSTEAAFRFVPDADQDATIEVADRFGGGGPDFGFRLTAGPPRPDFAALVVPEGSTGVGNRARGPGRFGVFNVRPGEEAGVDFSVVPDGYVGTIEVEARGLPGGAGAEPVQVRVSKSSPPILRGTIWVEVAAGATPGLGSFEVVAIGRPEGGVEPIERTMTAAIDASAAPGVRRTISRFPIRVLGP